MDSWQQIDAQRDAQGMIPTNAPEALGVPRYDLIADGNSAPVARRSILLLGLAGLGTLAACTTAPATRTAFLTPEPIWPGAARSHPPVPAGPAPAPATCDVTSPVIDRNAKAVHGVIPRTRWARGNPDTTDLNKMITPIKWVTIHHDGLDSPMLATSMDDTAARIEWIRCGHRGRGFSDIGYHYIIDREGRVWEGRNLRWQGAHVSKHNEQNIGILVAGNFDIQKPTSDQLEGLRQHVRTLKTRYTIPSARVLTHREWSGARTACPGKNLQASVVSARAKKAW